MPTGSGKPRKLCAEPGCENVAEAYGHNPERYRKLCSTHRKFKKGTPIGGWQRWKKIKEDNLKEACEDCGLEVWQIGRLDIHHEDGDKYNNSPENLITLCPNCHRRRHHPSLASVQRVPIPEET